MKPGCGVGFGFFTFRQLPQESSCPGMLRVFSRHCWHFMSVAAAFWLLNGHPWHLRRMGYRVPAVPENDAACLVAYLVGLTVGVAITAGAARLILEGMLGLPGRAFDVDSAFGLGFCFCFDFAFTFAVAVGICCSSLAVLLFSFDNGLLLSTGCGLLFFDAHFFLSLAPCFTQSPCAMALTLQFNTKQIPKPPCLVQSPRAPAALQPDTVQMCLPQRPRAFALAGQPRTEHAAFPGFRFAFFDFWKDGIGRGRRFSPWSFADNRL